MSDFESWVGRREECDELISATPIRLLAATLDSQPPNAGSGEVVPLLWHWLYFLPGARQSDLGPDGHPRRGLFFPPVPMTRRMFAASSVRVLGPLRVGDRATHTREIVSIGEKEGRSGPLVFVRVEVTVSSPDGPVLQETQTIVYTDARPAPDPGPITTLPVAPWQSEVSTNPGFLFRFSALTFNAHGIHYDAGYATGVERYPGLVVHGPLTAILLADLASRHGLVARAFSFRGVTPITCGEVVHLRGTPTADGADLVAYTESGAVAMLARATNAGARDGRAEA